MTDTYQAGSTQYLTVTVVHDSPLAPPLTVEVSLTGSAWVEAAWFGPTEVSLDDGRTWRAPTVIPSPGRRIRFRRKARTAVPITFEAGDYEVLVRVPGPVETPILRAGEVVVRERAFTL